MDETLTPNQWNELKSRIRLQYPELSDADLQYHESVELDMLNMVENCLRKTKSVVKGIIAGHDRIFPLQYYWRYNRHSRVKQGVK
jgi:hypothetical protein